MKRLLIFGCWCLPFLLFWSRAWGQEYDGLSEEEKWELRLQSHLLVDIDKITPSNVPVLLERKAPIALLVHQDSKKQEELIATIAAQHKDLVILYDMDTCEELGSSYNLIKIPKNIIESLVVSAKTRDTVLPMFKTAMELGLITVEKASSLKDSTLFNIWKNSGRKPTFVQVAPELLASADSLVGALNATRKVYGTLKSKEGLLYNVSFKDKKDILVQGLFSFPLSKQNSLPVFIPHKPGYYFSPDIIITTPENRDNIKEFVGFPLDFEYGLTDHFSFDTAVKNTIRKNDREILSNNIKVYNDPVRGTVGYLSEGAFVDAGINSRGSLQGSFTISGWIKPTELSNNNSILGKGDNFVLKLHKGYLTFTMAGVKDYISNTSKVPLNEWTHVGLVHSKVKDELYFYLNGKQTDKIKLIENYDTSDFNILIGSNLWQEFFTGYITDIKIWERELNADEIQKDFENTSANGFSYNYYLLIVGLGLIAVFGFIGYRVFNRFNTLPRKPTITPQEIVEKPVEMVSVKQDVQEKILCFGALRILTAEGEDVAKKLSPKLKQLFVVVLLNSIEGKKGITTKKLTELLWPGMSVQEAKNTRGTNIQNLRAILSASTGILLSFKDKSWMLELGDNSYCDYQRVQKFIEELGQGSFQKEDLEKQLPSFFNILKEDRFLTNIKDSWFDPFLERFSHQIIEVCTDLSAVLEIDDHAAVLYDLAKVMYLYDELNETALKIKLQILIKQGKLSLARKVYNNFTKLYEELYGDSYLVRFEDVVANEPV
ncbi:Concanavalin A-like lectin/glucanases superfamily protein [Arenibacter nanhaiticus]|uniref:Concanavalin A-like lectin/glucanases superfamily protein n=1 Tax=Arenibacter nanhaiticus TaxID=558155 RepID=A0A1M6EYN3_9FLAO|nr:Concanavalin A-like lectin/glucanases superfamily protein [Arenibacter nanhaiticus]